MSDKFEDDLIPGGGGAPPTKDITVAVFNRLRRVRGKASTKDVLTELTALDYKTSKATVGRMLDGVEGREKAPAHLNDAEKRRQRARQNNRDSHKPRDGGSPPKMAKEPKQIGEAAMALLESFVESEGVSKARALADDESVSAAVLAIKQNRYRMALGIVASEMLMDNPRAMLVDPRGAAALLDSLTVSSKLSGGAAIDMKPDATPNGEVPRPTNGVSPNGHPMKELNPPKSPLLEGLEQFQRERAASNAQRN